jgi:hypothetical protein
MGASAVHGYSGKTLGAKLGYRAGQRVRVLGAPDGYWALCAIDPATLEIRARGDGLHLVHAFATSRAALARALPKLAAAIAPDGMLWLSWPKKSAGVASDLSEDVLRELALPLGLVDVKVCAVDATWSALKLVWRRTRR